MGGIGGGTWLLPAAFRTEWRWLLWPTLAGLELAHLNAAKLGI